MSDAVYQRRCTELDPALRAVLPPRWPSALKNKPDHQRTIEVLRQRCSTLNHLGIAVGWGAGQAILHLAKDPININRTWHWLILPNELEDFAHFLGSDDFLIMKRFRACSLHFAPDLAHALTRLLASFAGHEEISRMAGTTLLVEHPLGPEATGLRASWLPEIRRALVERFDCLGNDAYDTFLGLKHSLMHGDQLFTARRNSDLKGCFPGCSAIVIGSGPSAMEHLERIREIQHEHVIICADSFLAGCVRAGIEPDFVTMMERPEEQHTIIKDWADKTKAWFWCLPVVHRKATDFFPNRTVFWWAGDDLYPWLDDTESSWPVGRSTGTMGIAAPALLGCTQVYLVGHDLAYGDDGRSYAGGVDPTAQANDAKFYGPVDAASATNPNYYARTIEVPRNGGGTVRSRGIWGIFRTDVETFVRLTPGVRYINPNINRKRGAAIAGTIAGELPEPSGVRLDKRLPDPADRSRGLAAYRDRRGRLLEDWDQAMQTFQDALQEMAPWQPLTVSAQQASEMAKRLDLGQLVSKENAAIFRYVFRAILRNVMVRLQQNLFVHTHAERIWNQVLATRLYAESVINLAAVMRRELVEILEQVHV